MSARVGAAAALVNAVSVTAFALSMLCGFDFGSYLASMFIAFSFVPLVCAYCTAAAKAKKGAALTAAVFAGIYAALILLVYMTQLTAVRAGDLSYEASSLLDFRAFGLFFGYDLLGYGVMALSTFFAGLALTPQTRADKWLRGLLLGHGAFFLPCLIMPMTGVFAAAAGAELIGTLLLTCWCAYFMPVGVLSFVRFYRRCRTERQNGS